MIRRLGKKKAEALALAGKPWPRSSITASRKAPRKRNPKRKAREFARCYHSEERVFFVKGLPCAACGFQDLSGIYPNANAHVLGNGGLSRKAGYKTIAPLCEDHGYGVMERVGCHKLYDRYRWVFDARYPDFDPVEAARTCELAWEAFQNQEQEEG